MKDLNPSPHPSPYGRGSRPSQPCELTANTLRTSRALLQEHVVGGVRSAVKRASRVASAGADAALGVEALHRRDARQQAGAAMRRHLELEPGDIARRLAR